MGVKKICTNPSSAKKFLLSSIRDLLVDFSEMTRGETVEAKS